MMKTNPAKEHVKNRVPVENLDLDTPFEDDVLTPDIPFVTGEPGLGRKVDILRAKSSRYVSSSILGRLPS